MDYTFLVWLNNFDFQGTSMVDKALMVEIRASMVAA